MTWTLHYHPEVAGYLRNLRESGSALRQVIRELEADPRREEAKALEDWPNTYDLFEEAHRIRYMVLDEEKIVRIVLVKPGREEDTE